MRTDQAVGNSLREVEMRVRRTSIRVPPGVTSARSPDLGRPELLRDVRRRRWSNRATALAMTAWKTAFFIPHRLRLHVNTVPWICGLGMGLAVSLMPGSGLSNA